MDRQAADVTRGDVALSGLMHALPQPDPDSVCCDHSLSGFSPEIYNLGPHQHFSSVYVTGIRDVNTNNMGAAAHGYPALYSDRYETLRQEEAAGTEARAER